eukprot:g75194.t1
MAESKINNQPKKDHVFKVQVISADLPDESVSKDAINLAKEALTKYTYEKDMASHIRTTLDKVHGTGWQVVVGRSFGSSITHETKHFLHVQVDSMAFLVFKAGVKLAAHWENFTGNDSETDARQATLNRPSKMASDGDINKGKWMSSKVMHRRLNIY